MNESDTYVAETYAKIGDCLERMARVEPDKVLARTEVRASDGMHKMKKVSAFIGVRGRQILIFCGWEGEGEGGEHRVAQSKFLIKKQNPLTDGGALWEPRGTLLVYHH
ncbi:unnamed protein product [Cylicostephanus goldi]|uniref:Uncharacterized protein n=1 Tax=Cylicostephanus goldi TaxID=71465 RepID=A0A3P6QBP1_CYLGO|nr:unnamed protein product [Cylicostephanus goldi]